MREYLVIMETVTPKREIEVLYRSNDDTEALDKLVIFSDKLEESIVAGKCRVMMTTYTE